MEIYGLVKLFNCFIAFEGNSLLATAVLLNGVAGKVIPIGSGQILNSLVN